VPDAGNPSRTIGTVSLVLGLLAVIPLGALAGLPAIVLALVALRQEPRSRGRATAGAVLGAVGTFATVALTLLLIFTTRPGKAACPALANADATRYNLYEIQVSLDEWAAGHGGAFPYRSDFDSDSSGFVKFLARDRVG
jgi:hypothetical protein